MCVCVLVTQSCPTLCDPMDCSPPGSSAHGILQARILECVACPPSGDLPDPGIEPASLMSPALQALPLAPPGKPSPSISEVYFLIVSGGHSGEGSPAPLAPLPEIHSLTTKYKKSAATLCQAEGTLGQRRKSPALRELRVHVWIFRTQSGESGSSHCLERGTDINSHTIT